MLNAHPLTPEQQDLLRRFVEAAQAVPVGDRLPFYLSRTLGEDGGRVQHSGWQGDPRINLAAVEELERQGLLERQQQTNPLRSTTVTQRGFAYHAELELRNSDPPVGDTPGRRQRPRPPLLDSPHPY